MEFLFHFPLGSALARRFLDQDLMESPKSHQRRRWRESQLQRLCCQRDQRSGMTSASRYGIGIHGSLASWLPKVRRVLRDWLESGMEKPHPAGSLGPFADPGIFRILQPPGLCPVLPPFPPGHHSKAPHIPYKYFPESASNFFFFTSFHLGTVLLEILLLPPPWVWDRGCLGMCGCLYMV